MNQDHPTKTWKVDLHNIITDANDDIVDVHFNLCLMALIHRPTIPEFIKYQYYAAK